MVIKSKIDIGSFICYHLVEGDFVVMKTNDKSLYTVKGIHKYEGKKDEPVPQLFINDDGQIIVIKNHN